MKKLNDAQMINDVLAGEKELAKLYLNSILESSCPKMRATLEKVHTNVTAKQFECFEYMQKNNLYPVDYVQPQQITQAIDKYASL